MKIYRQIFGKITGPKDDSKGGYPVYDTISKETVWTEQIEWVMP